MSSLSINNIVNKLSKYILAAQKMAADIYLDKFIMFNRAKDHKI